MIRLLPLFAKSLAAVSEFVKGDSASVLTFLLVVETALHAVKCLLVGLGAVGLRVLGHVVDALQEV